MKVLSWCRIHDPDTRSSIMYRYLNNPEVPSRQRALDNYQPGDIIVQQRTRDTRYYIYKNLQEMYKAYTRMHPVSRVFNEVILEGPQKFRLDIDTWIKDEDDMRYVVRTISRIMRCLVPSWDKEVFIYDISCSHHIVVPGLAMDTSGCCHMVANIICHILATRVLYVVDAIDLDVYKGTQMFRMEGSTKHMQYRWKYLRGMSELTPIELFHKGVIGHVSGCRMVDTDDIVALALSSHVYRIPRWDEMNPEEGSTYMDTRAFTVRRRMGDMTILDRTRPSYCQLCRRVHEHENAYMIGNRMYCRRYRR